MYVLSGQQVEPYLYCIDNNPRFEKGEGVREVVILINSYNCPVYINVLTDYLNQSEQYNFKLRIIPLNLQNKEEFNIFINETIGIMELTPFFEYDSILNSCFEYFKTFEAIIFRNGALKKTIKLNSTIQDDFSFFKDTKELIAKVRYNPQLHYILAHTSEGERLLTYNPSAHNTGTFFEYFDMEGKIELFSGFWLNEELIRNFYKIIHPSNDKFEEAWSKRSVELKNRMLAGSPELVFVKGEFKEGYFYFSGTLSRIQFNQQGQWRTQKHTILVKLDKDLEVSDFWLFPTIIQFDNKEDFSYYVFHHFISTNIFLINDTLISPVIATEILEKTQGPEKNYFLAKFHLGNDHKGKFTEVLKYQVPKEKTELFNMYHVNEYFLWKSHRDGYKVSFIYSPLVFYLDHPPARDTMPESCLHYDEIKNHIKKSDPGKLFLQFFIRGHTVDINTGITYIDVSCLGKTIIYKLNPESGMIEFTGIKRSEKGFRLLYVSEEHVYYYVPSGDKEAVVYREKR